MSRLACGCELVDELVVPPWGGDPMPRTTMIPCRECADRSAQQERDAFDTPTGPCSVCRGEGVTEATDDLHTYDQQCQHCEGSGSEPECQHHWDPRDCVLCFRESRQQTTICA